MFFFFLQQKTAYEMRISDWSSDVCSSELLSLPVPVRHREPVAALGLDADQRCETGPPQGCHRLVLPVLGDAGPALAHDMPFEPRAALRFLLRHGRIRSEGRRVGKGCVSTCGSRGWRYY